MGTKAVKARRRKQLFIFGLLIGIGLALWWRASHQTPTPPSHPIALPTPNSTFTPTDQETSLEKLKKQFLAQLNKEDASKRTLDIPQGAPEEPVAKVSPPKSMTPEERERSEGRKKRANLPMGVVVWDNIPVYDSETGKKVIYQMQTGDFVRVIAEKTGRVQVHPGLDLYLAATTKDIQAAGERLPDAPGWVERSHLNIFKPEQAKEFIHELSPVTLGEDPTFSTLAFYERAMKNPDPVVHRIIAPRLISLVSLHEDYGPSWPALYRDRDPKIRDAALASLRERGVGQSRLIIEDLILRVSELTRPGRVSGEKEEEVLQVLRILKESRHPRVPAALASFTDSWKAHQGDRLNQALADILKNN